MRLNTYIHTLVDALGRTIEIVVDGENIADIMSGNGITEDAAADDLFQNAAGNAVARGEIGPECWVIATRTE